MYIKVILFVIVVLSGVTATVFAQDTTRPFLSKGHLYGQVFGDYFYKVHADSLNRGYNQYAGLPEQSNAFQLRRIYLGYKYAVSSRFTADLLLESVMEDNKMTFFIKYATLRWKEIFGRTDLVIGRMKTPAFSTVTDKIWHYRSIERSITDMHGSPSYDLGVALQGHFDEADHFGYTLMVGNGNPGVASRFKKFYGELYTKLADKRLIFDLYADYERLHWQPGFHQSVSMIKVFAAYQVPAFTIGAEAYSQYLQNSLVQKQVTSVDTTNGRNFGLSTFVHGKLWKDKLGFFVRLDHFNPFTNLEKGSGSARFTSLISKYDPVNRNRFITAGLDYSPVKNVHFMPNVWYCRYKGLSGRQNKDHDLVYRLTFFYKFDG